MSEQFNETLDDSPVVPESPITPDRFFLLDGELVRVFKTPDGYFSAVTASGFASAPARAIIEGNPSTEAAFMAAKSSVSA